MDADKKFPSYASMFEIFTDERVHIMGTVRTLKQLHVLVVLEEEFFSVLLTPCESRGQVLVTGREEGLMPPLRPNRTQGGGFVCGSEVVKLGMA